MLVQTLHLKHMKRENIGMILVKFLRCRKGSRNEESFIHHLEPKIGKMNVHLAMLTHCTAKWN